MSSHHNDIDTMTLVSPESPTGEYPPPYPCKRKDIVRWMKTNDCSDTSLFSDFKYGSSDRIKSMSYWFAFLDEPDLFLHQQFQKDGESSSDNLNCRVWCPRVRSANRSFIDTYLDLCRFLRPLIATGQLTEKYLMIEVKRCFWDIDMEEIPNIEPCKNLYGKLAWSQYSFVKRLQDWDTFHAVRLCNFKLYRDYRREVKRFKKENYGKILSYVFGMSPEKRRYVMMRCVVFFDHNLQLKKEAIECESQAQLTLSAFQQIGHFWDDSKKRQQVFVRHPRGRAWISGQGKIQAILGLSIARNVPVRCFQPYTYPTLSENKRVVEFTREEKDFQERFSLCSKCGGHSTGEKCTENPFLSFYGLTLVSE